MRPFTAVSAVLLTAVLAGCAGSGPDVPEESAFAEGTCRTAAPDVRAVGQSLPELGEGGRVDPQVRDALREAQDRLDALADGAEPALRPALTDLVQKIGIVRIRADGNTYEPQFGDGLTSSYAQVVQLCTGAGAAG
ncbi:MAG: hypothetical protein WD794_05365 [Mycobacteriales bacterium]